VAFIPIVIIMFALLWFAMIRPQRRQRQTQAHMLETLDVGDEIVTAGGLYGEIRALDDEDLTLRIAPNVDIRVARRAVVGNITLDRQAETEEGELGEEEEASETKSPEPEPS
jgi:preprotein translocase subunit YajC